MSSFRRSGMRGRRAFTLAEIMIVIMILGILLGIAVPEYQTARESSRTSTCLDNLKQIESAKEVWAMQTQQAASATPQQADLVPGFMKSFPSCPAAGIYAIGALGVRPTCTVPGHTLP